MRFDDAVGLALMIWPFRRRRVNFTNPVNGRLWLNLLQSHPRYGLHFKRDLRMSRHELGFSFSSNRYGLRGPENTLAPNVLLGTSFAMGLSVNDGDNWYEQALDPAQWFNAAMPVGPGNQVKLLDDLYQGSGNTLLYLYHPNIWKTAQGYLTAEERGSSIFEVMRWKADFKSILSLFPKWITKEVAKTWIGLSQYRRTNGRLYYFNAAYCRIDYQTNQDLFRKVSDDFAALFAKFRRVVIVRVPIKEELAADQALSPQLVALAQTYDCFWNAFAATLAPHVRTYALARSAFNFDDFLPYDTHWSVQGNLKFAKLLRPILVETGTSGVQYGFES